MKYTGRPTAKTFRALLTVTVIASSTVAVAAVLVTSVLSFEVATKTVFEFLSVVRYISVADFLERVESILLVGWISLSYLSVATVLLGSVITLQTVFGLKDYRALTLPAAIIVVTLSQVLFPNIRARTAFIEHTAVPYDLIFEFVIPLILLSVAYLRRNVRRRLTQLPEEGNWQ